MIVPLLFALISLSGSFALSLPKPDALLRQAHGKLLEVMDQRETDLIRQSLQAHSKTGIDTSKFRRIAEKMVAQKEKDLGAFGPRAYALLEDVMRLEQASPIGSAARIEQVQKGLLQAWDTVVANKAPFQQHYRPRIFRREAVTNALVNAAKTAAKKVVESGADAIQNAKNALPDTRPPVAVHEPPVKVPQSAKVVNEPAVEVPQAVKVASEPALDVPEVKVASEPPLKVVHDTPAPHSPQDPPVEVFQEPSPKLAQDSKPKYTVEEPESDAIIPFKDTKEQEGALPKPEKFDTMTPSQLIEGLERYITRKQIEFRRKSFYLNERILAENNQLRGMTNLDSAEALRIRAGVSELRRQHELLLERHTKWATDLGRKMDANEWRARMNFQKQLHRQETAEVKAIKKSIKDLAKNGDPDNKLPNLKMNLKHHTEMADKAAENIAKINEFRIGLEKTSRKAAQSFNEDRLVAIPEVSFFRTQRGKIVGWALGTGAFGGLLVLLFNSVSPPTTIA